MTRHQLSRSLRVVTGAALLVICSALIVHAQNDGRSTQPYQHDDTRALVSLVNEAATLVMRAGESAFAEFREDHSQWREGDRYIFVLDPDGTMLVHPDPSMEGRNQLGLKDVAGKPIIKGLIDAATITPAKSDGWYHYQWPVPGGLLPRWKSSYVRLVDMPSGHRYIVGSGVYNDRMERAFVVNLVTDAVAAIERDGVTAFEALADPAGPFRAKDAYVWVIGPDGKDLVNPGFPNLQGRDLLDLKDAEGKPLVREMLGIVKESGAGWANYMWPKPGDSRPTEKSTYVSKAKLGDSWVMVGCGVYLADAPTRPAMTSTMKAPELMALVRDAAALVEAQGEDAYVRFRERGSKWFSGDTYLFAWSTDGIRTFHAAEPAGEGQNVREMSDILGRPIGRMILDAANSTTGEGWVHYMYPEPGSIFPIWKSTFVKRVTLPSNQQAVLGSGIYNMQMDRTFIEDLVNRAADLVAAKGSGAFDALRDKTGPFRFMDTYVFVDTPEGVEVVNPAQPGMEGRVVKGLTDLKGKAVADDYIALAMKDGSGWIDYYWYRPGQNTETRKWSFVRKVQFGSEIFIVGSGLYADESPALTH